MRKKEYKWPKAHSNSLRKYFSVRTKRDDEENNVTQFEIFAGISQMLEEECNLFLCTKFRNYITYMSNEAKKVGDFFQLSHCLSQTEEGINATLSIKERDKKTRTISIH